jgi:hypothetical protein
MATQTPTRTRKARSLLVVGDIIHFTHVKRGTVIALVERVNTKTVTATTATNGGSWKISRTHHLIDLATDEEVSAFRAEKRSNDPRGKFSVGDLVEFDHKGDVIRGKIERINTKTISLSNGWRCSPGCLRPSTADAAPLPKALEGFSAGKVKTNGTGNEGHRWEQAFSLGKIKGLVDDDASGGQAEVRVDAKDRKAFDAIMKALAVELSGEDDAIPHGDLMSLVLQWDAEKRAEGVDLKTFLISSYSGDLLGITTAEQVRKREEAARSREAKEAAEAEEKVTQFIDAVTAYAEQLDPTEEEREAVQKQWHRIGGTIKARALIRAMAVSADNAEACGMIFEV